MQGYLYSSAYVPMKLPMATVSMLVITGPIGRYTGLRQRVGSRLDQPIRSEAVAHESPQRQQYLWHFVHPMSATCKRTLTVVRHRFVTSQHSTGGRSAAIQQLRSWPHHLLHRWESEQHGSSACRVYSLSNTRAAKTEHASCRRVAGHSAVAGKHAMVVRYSAAEDSAFDRGVS